VPYLLPQRYSYFFEISNTPQKTSCARRAENSKIVLEKYFSALAAFYFLSDL
jgi:hypothetical protein